VLVDGAMKRLIVNADDFGMSPEVNAGIIRAHRDGIVTSTTILATGAAFEGAVRLAHAHPTLRVGVHLDLVEGRPIAPATEVSSLLSRRGTFLGSSAALALRCLLGRVDHHELVRELSAQIQRVVDAGLRPSHIDSHMHSHCLPEVAEAALDAAARFGIRRARFPREQPLPGPSPRPLRRRSRARSAVVGQLAGLSHERLVRWGACTTDHFVGPRLMGALDARVLADLIGRIPDGTTELMCHPAAGAAHDDHIVRGEELAALTSPAVRAAVEAHRVTLASFDDLPARA
jgi:chitin disaccharide deacetylase